MTRPEITAKLSAMVEKKINPHNDPRIYWAREVTFDYYTDHAIRVDYMKFVPANNSVSGIEKADCYCYEIKSSVEDFKENWETYFSNEPAALDNIHNSKTAKIVTPDATICIQPDKIALIELKEINGVPSLVVPVNGELKINGIEVELK
mgnify:CR=1 FL=1